MINQICRSDDPLQVKIQRAPKKTVYNAASLQVRRLEAGLELQTA